MRNIKYTRIDKNPEESRSEEFISFDFSTKSTLFVLILIVFSIFFVFYFNGSLRVQSRSKIVFIPSKYEGKYTERNITNFQDHYFSKEESQFLNCSELIDGNEDAINLYVTYGRMKLNEEKLLKLPMDCDSIRNRLLGDLSHFKPLKRSIAFVRNIFGLHELQEVLLSISYHPDNFYCYAIDSKSSERLKTSIRTMSKCLENVFVLDKEYNMDRGGHKQDEAHFDCLKRLLNKNWSHAITLQNFDLIIKTPEQLSDLSDILNTTSTMGSDYGFTSRYNVFADWTPSGMRLFKNESVVSKEILHRKLVIRKSLNQVILSKVFLKSLFENVNLGRVIKRFDNESFFGVDEMMVMTLYQNYLGLSGQMESNCTEEREDNLTRLTYWHLEQSDGYYPDCKSNWLRHSICVFGVEYLQEFTKSLTVIANKVTEDFDFGTIICTREMIKTKRTGSIPDADWLSRNFPQFLEMQMKANGTYNKTKFQC